MSNRKTHILFRILSNAFQFTVFEVTDILAYDVGIKVFEVVKHYRYESRLSTFEIATITRGPDYFSREMVVVSDYSTVSPVILCKRFLTEAALCGLFSEALVFFCNVHWFNI